MNQSEMLSRVSEKINLPKYHCERVLDAMKRVIIESLSNGEDVKLRGFCTFEVTNRKKRNGYNPITGELEEFEAVKSARCKMGIPVKRAVKTGVWEDFEEDDE